MQAPREGSRKAAVFAAFTSSGEKAAYKVAEEQGLKVGTVKSWLGGWAKGGPVVEKKSTAKPAPEPKVHRKSNGVSIKWSSRPVQLLAKGEQCSEIKWLDSGSTQTISNDQINFAKQA